MSVRVRLCDVPYQVRVAAARHLSAYEPHVAKKAELLTAAVFPSDNVYLLSDAALPQVLALEAWKQAA